MKKRNFTPKVSIGMPVYNGERYLEAALESIQGQTYENFELIISDNASTDRTGIICRNYAKHDSRIRYNQQSTNRGASPNFNKVFELAKGSKYFKWAAHDDWVAPTYLEECVSMLEGSPDAVLCQSLVTNVDADGLRSNTYNPLQIGVDLPRPSDRFGAQLRGRRCTEIFGVIRSDTLASTGLIRSQLGGDRPLLVELALRGRFVLIQQRLFFHRDHDERYIRRVYRRCPPEEELAWYTTSRATSGATLRTWMLYGEYLRIIRNSRIGSRAERLRCYGHLLRSLVSRRANLVNLVLEPFTVLRLRPGFRLKRGAWRREARSKLDAGASPTARDR